MFTIFEVLDVAVMTAVIGYLFHDVLRAPHGHGKRDIIDYYRGMRHGFSWHDFWWAAGIVLPSILVHELGHKFAGLAMGLQSTFHAACSTAHLLPGGAPFLDTFCLLTVVSIVLKVAGVPFLFFVPGYVSTAGVATGMQQFLLAIAGPAVNLVFWLGARQLRLSKARITRKQRHALYLLFFEKINMFLFIFNMIPIPGFDGWQVLMGIIRMLS
jgi:Zn-dependent protease